MCYFLNLFHVFSVHLWCFDFFFFRVLMFVNLGMSWLCSIFDESHAFEFFGFWKKVSWCFSFFHFLIIFPSVGSVDFFPKLLHGMKIGVFVKKFTCVHCVCGEDCGIVVCVRVSCAKRALRLSDRPWLRMEIMVCVVCVRQSRATVSRSPRTGSPPEPQTWEHAWWCIVRRSARRHLMCVWGLWGYAVEAVLGVSVLSRKKHPKSCYLPPKKCRQKKTHPHPATLFLGEGVFFVLHTIPSVWLHLLLKARLSEGLSVSCCRLCGARCGPSTSFPVGHRCTVCVLAGTHRCATESRVTLWQSANPSLLLLFQRRLRCEMCMTTNDQRCKVTETNLHGALHDEELFSIEGSSCTEQQKPPQTAKKWRSRRNNVQIPTCKPRSEKLQPEASTVRERTLQDSSLPQRRKCVKFVQSLL